MRIYLPLSLVLATAVSCSKSEKADPVVQEVPANESGDTDPMAGIEFVKNLDPDSPDTVALSEVPVEVGFTYSLADTSTMQTEFQNPGTNLKIAGTTMENKKIEVLAVSEGLASRAKVSYGDFSEVRRTNGVEKVSDDSIANKTYIVVRTNGQLVLSDEAGKDVSNEEAELLANDLKYFGKPNKWQKALSGKTFKTGERQALPDLASVIGDMQKVQGTPDIGVTLKGFRDSHAVFILDAALSLGDASTTVDAVFVGAFSIDPATSLLQTLQLKNTLTFSGSLPGTGSTRGSKTWTYE